MAIPYPDGGGTYTGGGSGYEDCGRNDELGRRCLHDPTNDPNYDPTMGGTMETTIRPWVVAPEVV